MNKHSFYKYNPFTLLFCFFLLFLSGCEKETIENKEEGDISIDLELSTNSNFLPVTRAFYSDSLFVLPEADDFKIQILNASGELLKEWASYSEVPHPIKIQVSRFQIKALYGDPEKSGFNQPSFSGDTTIQIKGARENRVKLTTSFANVLASVHYREGYKNYFKDYNTQMMTSRDTVFFSKEEKRTAFFPCGSLKVVLNLTKNDSTTYTFPAAILTNTKAAEYYRFNMDIEGGQGYEKLLISFDSTTTAHPIEIELPQDWQSHKKPYLSPAFDTLQKHSYLVGESCAEGTLYTLITAIGKIGSCKITTASENLIAAGWPAEADLLNLTSANKNRLTRFGLKWSENMENANMAELDFSGIVANLPAGSHTITVDVADIYGQHSIPLNITFSIIPPVFQLMQPEQPAIARSLEYPFKVCMNGGDPDNIIIEFLNENPAFGVKEWTSCKINSWNWNSTKDTVLLKASVNINKAALQFRAKYDTETTDEVTVNAINPTFQLQKDGLEWAKYVKLNIEQTDGTNGLAQNTLTEQYSIQISTDQSSWTPASNDGIKFDKTNNLVKFRINQLNANQTYYVRVAFDAKAELDVCYSAPLEIKTEPAIDLPTIALTEVRKQNIQKGGKYGAKKWGGFIGTGWADLEYANVIYYEASSPWNTVNLKTIPSSANPTNTWYVIATSLPQNNGVLLRNAGWDNNGPTVPEGTNNVDQSLNDLTPPVMKHYSAGKLFLSSGYSYNHTSGEEQYNEGYEFTSRPTKLQFSYTYKSLKSDEALVRIIVEAADGTIIGQGEEKFDYQESLLTGTVSIKYTIENKAAARLKIMFASSASCSYDQATEDSQIKEFTADNKGEAIRTGSEFYIENVGLLYE